MVIFFLFPLVLFSHLSFFPVVTRKAPKVNYRLLSGITTAPTSTRSSSSRAGSVISSRSLSSSSSVSSSSSSSSSSDAGVIVAAAEVITATSSPSKRPIEEVDHEDEKKDLSLKRFRSASPVAEVTAADAVASPPSSFKPKTSPYLFRAAPFDVMDNYLDLVLYAKRSVEFCHLTGTEVKPSSRLVQDQYSAYLMAFGVHPLCIPEDDFRLGCYVFRTIYSPTSLDTYVYVEDLRRKIRLRLDIARLDNPEASYPFFRSPGWSQQQPAQGRSLCLGLQRDAGLASPETSMTMPAVNFFFDDDDEAKNGFDDEAYIDFFAGHDRAYYGNDAVDDGPTPSPLDTWRFMAYLISHRIHSAGLDVTDALFSAATRAFVAAHPSPSTTGAADPYIAYRRSVTTKRRDEGLMVFDVIPSPKLTVSLEPRHCKVPFSLLRDTFGGYSDDGLPAYLPCEGEVNVPAPNHHDTTEAMEEDDREDTITTASFSSSSSVISEIGDSEDEDETEKPLSVNRHYQIAAAAAVLYDEENDDKNDADFIRKLKDDLVNWMTM